jgi:hypothetical protein
VLKNDEENHLDQLRGKRSVTVNEKKNSILHTIKRKKGNWIGYDIGMNCPLKRVIEKNRKDGNTRKNT